MTTTFAQLSLWEEQEQPCEDAKHSIKVIYFGGRREVYQIGSPEWEEVARDMSVWSAEFVKSQGPHS